MNRNKTYLLWLSVWVFLLSACGGSAPEETSKPVTTGLVVPTFTVSESTRQAQQGQTTAATTSTSAPTTAPVNNGTHLLTTATPIPTATNAAATLPSPPTAIAAAPIIHTFTAELSDHANGTDKMVTFHWQTSSGTTIRINDYVNRYQRFVPGWNVEASGTMTITLGASLNQNLYYELIVYNSNDSGTVVQQGVNIAWPCQYTYFFVPPTYLFICPIDGVVYSAAAEQQFEHGRMIWLAQPQHTLFSPQATIIVVYDISEYPQQSWQEYPDLWIPENPVDDPTLIPPTGFYQPTRGFGEVWRLYPEVRERLGWAIAPEVGYSAGQQSVPYTAEEAVFLGVSDGRVLWLGRSTFDQSPYWQWLE